MTIGEKLKRERKKLGHSLDNVAERTKIAKMFLIAIENDDLSSLPGGVYTRNFLREYAKFLNLDEDIVTAEYHEQYEVKPHFVIHQEQTKRDDYQFRKQRWRLFLWVLLISLLIAGCIAAVIYTPILPFFKKVENQASQPPTGYEVGAQAPIPQSMEYQGPGEEATGSTEGTSDAGIQNLVETSQESPSAGQVLPEPSVEKTTHPAGVAEGEREEGPVLEDKKPAREPIRKVLPLRSRSEIQQYLDDNGLDSSVVYGTLSEIENMFAIEAVEPVHVEVYIDGEMATRRFLQPGQVRFYSYGALNRVILGDVRRVNLQDRHDFFSGADQSSRNVFIYDFSKGEFLTRLREALKENP